MKKMPKNLSMVLTLVIVLLFVAPVAADDPPEDLPLETVKFGTVTGGFFFESENVWGAKPDGADRTVTFELPEYDSIEWARLYTLVFCGHMEDDRAGRVITSFDGGDGVTELGNELLNIPAPRNGQVYLVNDHVNRVTSDYQIWYDVTEEITGTEVTARVLSQEVDANWDGRIRYIALAVAYKDDDGEETTYWFNAGHAVTAPGYNPEPRETIFDTSVLSVKPDDAELTVVYTTWNDATYTFGEAVLPDAGTNATSFGAKTNSWFITDVSDDEPTTLTAERIGSSYKWTLAALVTKFDDSAIIAGSAEARTRDTIQVPVSVANITEAQGFGFVLSFDPTYATITGAVNVTPGMVQYEIKPGENRIHVSATTEHNITAGKEPVAIALINVTLSDRVGNSQLKFIASNYNLEYSSGFDSRTFAIIKDGTLVNILRGDLNRNGRVDIGDVAKVAWIAMDLVAQDPLAKFVDDGEPVNHADAARIAYYYVGKIPVL